MLEIDSITTRAWQRHDRNRRTKSRIYIFPVGETVLENFVSGRWNRPHQEYRKLLPQIFAEIGVEPAKARWSQKAGCPCGCSPGFVVEDLFTDDGSVWKAYDVYVDVKEG